MGALGRWRDEGVCFVTRDIEPADGVTLAIELGIWPCWKGILIPLVDGLARVKAAVREVFQAALIPDRRGPA